MGNRGILHDGHGNLTAKRWTHPHWVACRLDFKGRRQPINSPRTYSQLFFLDEVTALAAGHRPCAECRHDDFQRFREAWLLGNPDAGFDDSTSMSSVDRYIHNERINRSREKVTYPALIDGLPDCVFITMVDNPADAFLIRDNHLYLWRPEGYGQPQPIQTGSTVNVLTPRSIVRAIAAGYKPTIALD
jgi:hypothetical protein